MKTFLLSIFLSFYLQVLQCQDIIIKMDKTEIAAKVVEIQDEMIKYTLFESTDGPLRNIRTGEVFMIIYQNGSREIFKNRSEGSNSNTEIINSDPPFEENKIDKAYVFFEINDGRLDPRKIGYRYNSGLFYIPKIKHDKKNTYFKNIHSQFSNNLVHLGFSLSSDTSSFNHKLIVSVTQIELNDYDQFTHIKLVYICKVRVTLIKVYSNQILYSTDYSFGHECKRSQCDKAGFGIEVDNITYQLRNDQRLKNFINM